MMNLFVQSVMNLINICVMFKFSGPDMIEDVRFARIVDGSLYDDDGHILRLNSYPQQLNNSTILRFDYFYKYGALKSCVYLDNLVYTFISDDHYGFDIVELNDNKLNHTIRDELNQYLCNI